MAALRTIAILALMFGAGMVGTAIAQAPMSAPGKLPDFSSSIGQGSKNYSVKVEVSSAEDLKVQVGDSVQEGDIIADRTQQRSQLEARKKSLELSLESLKKATFSDPIQPLPVPQVNELPSANYQQEEAEVQSARLKTEMLAKSIEFEKSLPDAEAAQAQAKQLELEAKISDIQRRLESAKKVKDEIQKQGLAFHYQQNADAEIAQIESEIAIATAERDGTAIVFQSRQQQRLKKLSDLQLELERAKEEEQLASAKLEKAKSDRALLEHQNQLNRIRWIQEQNQQESIYQARLQEAAERRSQQQYRTADLESKIAAIDEKLQAIATVRSPYPGVVKRIVDEGQSNDKLNYRVIISVNRNSTPAGGAARSSAPTDDSPADE